jgi:hypothetical protein
MKRARKRKQILTAAKFSVFACRRDTPADFAETNPEIASIAPTANRNRVAILEPFARFTVWQL